MFVLNGAWFIIFLKMGLSLPSLPSITQITEPVDHSECPTWDPKTQLLYFVDIHSGKIFSYDTATGDTFHIQLNGTVAPIVPDKKHNTFIVGLNLSVVAIEWDGRGPLKNVKTLTKLPDDQSGSRTNDGKADVKGRFWIGTMGSESKGGVLTPNKGVLFTITKITLDRPTTVLSPVNISNGLIWNKANNKFFYIDSPSRQVAVFDYNSEFGQISNRQVAFDFIENGISGVPDGMTIDKDDNLWIAIYGGGSVIKVNPYKKQLLQRVAIPASSVSAVAWGGPKLDILFVTTSRFSLTAEESAKEPSAGAVFAVTNLKTNGLPLYKTDLL